MNVDAFPKSANVYDSASDAYVALDRRDDALRAAEKAMEVLPTNVHITEQLRTAKARRRKSRTSKNAKSV